MARFYQSKDKQTKPELAGEQNMTKEYIAKAKDQTDDGLMDSLIGLFDNGIKQKKKGTNWTPEELTDSIRDYFIYCADNSLKPSKSGICLWLGCNRSQYYRWGKEEEKFRAISNIVNLANQLIENQYINRGEKYPTMNVFLLKASHDYAETQNVNITGTTNIDEVAEAIKKLGLDK